MRSLTGAHFLYNEIKTAWSLNQAVLFLICYSITHSHIVFVTKPNILYLHSFEVSFIHYSKRLKPLKIKEKVYYFS